MTGGTISGYRQVLSSFYKDAENRLPCLSRPPGNADLSAFTIHAHALKSAAGTIGAAELSKEAAELEAAGKAGNIGAIEAALSGFYEHLQEIAKEIKTALELMNGEREQPEGIAADYSSLFRTLREALQIKDIGIVDRILAEIEGNSLDAKTREAAEQISNAVLMGKFEAALGMVDTIIQK
jgi:HPt (histidine-containing phosphotransfer) domain-containing protein